MTRGDRFRSARGARGRTLAALALCLVGCAPTVSPTPPAPGAEDDATLDPDVTELGRSLRRVPNGEHFVVFGDEAKRCFSTSNAGASGTIELRCGEAAVHATSMRELLRRVNEGELHRAIAIAALVEPRWARDALGRDTATPPTVTGPDGLRLELGPPFGVAEIRLGRRGSVQIHLAGLDGREIVDASHPRDAKKALGARLAALREEATLRLDTATGETLLAGLLARLDVEGRTLEGIQIGERSKGQPAFAGPGVQKRPTLIVADAFPGDTGTWTLTPPARERLRAETTSLSAETLQGRVIAVSLGGTLPQNTFSGAGDAAAHVPCERLRKAVERRFPISASQGERFVEAQPEPAAASQTLCRWQVVKNGLDVRVELSATGVSLSATLASSGREALLEKARELLDARDRARSCNLCGRVRVGARTRSGNLVLSVDRKRCAMVVETNDHHSPLDGVPFEMPCE